MLENLPSLRESLILVGSAVGTYVVLIAGAQLLRRTRGLMFGWTYHVFAVLFGLYLGLQLSGWASEIAVVLRGHVAAGAILFAAFPAIALINRILWKQGQKKGRGETPRVLADTIGLAIMLVAVLIVLEVIYGVRVPGLVAGSGVVAIILGLAMQDLLGNLMAGIALYFEKSFQTGDWLFLNDRHAKVIEISWRSTRLLTLDDVLIDVPNSEIVKQEILNFELPTPRHAVRTTIGLHYDIPPARVQEVLRQAAATVPGVCPDQPPVVYVSDYADSAIVYEIKVWIDDHAIMSRVLSDVRSHCWYAVRRAGMEIPYPQLTLHRARPVDTTAAARKVAADALRVHEIFSFLTPAQTDELVQHSPVALFAPNEHIIEQGAAGASMFLLVRGKVEVRITRDGQTSVVATLGPGACFGEMSVLTGDLRTATVVAVGEVEAVEIGKHPFASLIRNNPDVVGRLGDLLAHRQLANEKLAPGTTPHERRAATRATILRKLRGFFQLGE